MLFTEPAFLFFFLPVLLFLHFLTPANGRNALLAFTSLIFYGWGELRFVPIMLASIALNYALAGSFHKRRGGERTRARARWERAA